MEKKSLIKKVIIKGASQNHASHKQAKISVMQCFGINDPFDLPQIKKGENEQALQPPSLHCNFCTKAGVMFQSASSQPCRKRWVE